jgi:hypothetical protein
LQGHTPGSPVEPRFADVIDLFLRTILNSPARFMFAYFAAAAKIPSWFEFIRNEESRNAGEKPAHGFRGSLLKQKFV